MALNQGSTCDFVLALISVKPYVRITARLAVYLAIH